MRGFSVFTSYSLSKGALGRARRADPRGLAPGRLVALGKATGSKPTWMPRNISDFGQERKKNDTGPS